ISASLDALFFHAPSTTYIYTLSLHDALPIYNVGALALLMPIAIQIAQRQNVAPGKILMPPSMVAKERGMSILIGTPSNLIVSGLDRKSTRLNSSHVKISYAVFCLKQKKNQKV